jgi:DNA-binding transcriptional MocR family regulator
MAEALGYSRATISKKIKLLERSGLIRVEKRNRYHRVYHLLKVRCKPRETQMSTYGNSEFPQVDTNNNKLTRIINNIDISNFKKFKPKTKEELLALDLAKALKDVRGLSLYLSFAKRYPESLLRKVLGEVKEIPDRKIKKSRGALFNYLIQKYVKETSKNNRN